MPGKRSRAAIAEPTTASPNGTAEHTEPNELQVLEPMDRMPECGAMAAWGVRCTNDAFHPGAHSWGGEQEQLKPDHTKSCAFILSEAGDECDCGAADGRPSGSIEWGTELMRADVDARQATLPGTPDESEPLAEPDDYSVPLESQFNGRDLMDAPGLRTIGNRLIEQEDAFEHLRGVEIGWFWKRRGGTQGGNPRYGGIKRPDAFVKHYSGSAPIYLLYLSADHIRDAKFTATQIEAQLHELLCRTDVDPDDNDAYRIIGPDFVGSVATLKRFGLYKPDIRELGMNIKQLGLLDSLELDGPDGHDDSSDASEIE